MPKQKKGEKNKKTCPPNKIINPIAINPDENDLEDLTENNYKE